MANSKNYINKWNKTMKKLIISLLMLFFVLNMNAQEPQMKIYTGENKNMSFNLADIEHLSFTRSEKGSLLTIYQTPQLGDKYFLTNDISSMFANNRELIIYTEKEKYVYPILSIDSLTVKSIEFDKVIIGNQVWMKRNLDVTHYRNGDAIPEVIDPEKWEPLREGAWCYYDNDPENGKIYGKLYNWFAVNDERGLAPEGWRVASDKDWKSLELELGMTQHEADSWSDRGSPVAAKLAGDFDLWSDGELRNHLEFSSSGFSALPGGWREYHGSFRYINRYVYWWTSRGMSVTSSVNRYQSNSSTKVYRYHFNKGYGFSVRCVRDD